jgi:hypothetical protein
MSRFCACNTALRIEFKQLMSTLSFGCRQTVLDSVKGNQDRAIDVLLGMNDPSYVSERSTQDVSNRVLQARLYPTRMYKNLRADHLL